MRFKMMTTALAMTMSLLCGGGALKQLILQTPSQRRLT